MRSVISIYTNSEPESLNNKERFLNQEDIMTVMSQLMIKGKHQSNVVGSVVGADVAIIWDQQSNINKSKPPESQ